VLFEAIREIVSVLGKSKLRTTLTALSVAWGMFMLALLLGAGRGLENGATWEFRDDAVQSLWIHASQTSLPYAGRRPGRDIRLNEDDYSALDRNVPGLEHKSGRFYLWGEFFVSYGSKRASFDVRGVHPGHRFIEKTVMVRGRYLNDTDLRERRKVAVIGSQVRRTLMGEEDPIGKRILIRGLQYQIVGESEDAGSEAELRRIFIPATVAQAVYNNPGRLHNLAFTLKSGDLEQSRQIQQRTLSLFQRRHQVHPDDRRAIRVQNNLEEFRAVTEVFTWIRGFIWVVGIGTLLAAAIGVGNILLISVAERTKEIGIRKALGATSRSIVTLIVAEGIAITTLSGYTGIVLGVGLVELAAKSLKDVPFMREPSVDLRVAFLAAAALVVAGALASLLPALRAVRVDPIVALREGD
jgi:putative ABC transport system permease protein